MTTYDGKTSFYQWDINQKITDRNFKVGDEIHFYNMKLPTALVVLAYEHNGKVVANVPNILLQSSFPIIVYRMYTDNDGKYTRDEFTFKVNQRAKPDSYIYTETEIFNYSYLNERLEHLEGDGLTQVVSDYLKENPIKTAISIDEVKLPSAKWVGGNNLYSQVVTINGVTENSQVDLTPSVEQLVIFYEKDLTFVTENEDGVVTVYAIGQKPEHDYTIQVTITEVNV